MALLVAQSVAQGGTPLTTAAADAGGDSVLHGNNVRLYVFNDGEDPIDVTITSKVTSNPPQGPLNLVVEAPDGQLTIIPLGNGGFRDPATGRVAWTYEAVTGVTVAVVAG